MSWRFIFALLVLAAGTSVWGGLQLGEWLVAHGPVATDTPHDLSSQSVAVLDANGKPFQAQAPQPLVDGRLAIPEPLAPIDWEIPASSLETLKYNQVIALATTPITMVEAEQLAAGGHTKLTGIADAGDLMDSLNLPLQPVEMPKVPPPGPEEPQSNATMGISAGWQARLRQDLQACDAESFFDRPSCAWAARNKYCTPNNAWGRTSDCPAKSF